MVGMASRQALWMASAMLHGHFKMDNLLVFKGPYTPHIRIGDLGSCVELGGNGVDNAKIKWCITTYTAAPEMLITGQEWADAVTLAVNLYALGVVMMELAGTASRIPTV